MLSENYESSTPSRRLSVYRELGMTGVPQKRLPLWQSFPRTLPLQSLEGTQILEDQSYRNEFGLAAALRKLG